jgi:hypothetical protein
MHPIWHRRLLAAAALAAAAAQVMLAHARQVQPSQPRYESAVDAAEMCTMLCIHSPMGDIVHMSGTRLLRVCLWLC